MDFSRVFFKRKMPKARTCARTKPMKQSATCTLKRPAASKRTQYRRLSKIATKNEIIVARAFKELRVLYPHKERIGRPLLWNHLARALSVDVLKRLLKKRTFPGQLRQLWPGVAFHQKVCAELKKGKTVEEWHEMSQNSNCRLSRKKSYC